MRVIHFTSAGPWLQRALPALLQDEARNGLLLGVVQRLRSDANSYGDEPPLLALVEGGQRLCAAAAMTPPHRLLLWCEPTGSYAALDAFADDLRARGVALPGVVGPVPVASAFGQRWRARTGQALVPRMRMKVYQLRRVRYSGQAPGAPRPAAAGDLDLLIDWTVAFCHDARVTPVPDAERARRDVGAKIAAGDLLLWEDGGSPVSMAARTRATPTGICVSYVYTPAAQRRRGYATACVAALSQRELARGRRFVTLFADLANATSNAIYRRIGFEPLGDFGEFDFGGGA